MAKRILISVLIVLALTAGLGAIKSLQIKHMISQGEKFRPPPEPVTTAVVRSESWPEVLTAVGSLEAVQGVVVTAEMAGKVVRINFESGAKIAEGEVLIQQDTAMEAAQLKATRAAAAMTRLNLDRSSRLLPDKVIPRADYDNAEAAHEEASARANAIRTIIAKKTVKAPFSGHLGLRQVNIGQILNPGDPIVSLQTLDPIFVKFMLPQRHLTQLAIGLSVRIKVDNPDPMPSAPNVPNAPSVPDESLVGEITAINPQVDPTTRSIELQAKVDNTARRLRPGMYVNVSIVLPAQTEVLTIPATAVLYAAYGDSVFIVEEIPDAGDGEPAVTVTRRFVQLGEKRGDYVAVIQGLVPGQVVVSTGVFKLRNNQPVVVDNSLAPEFKYTPLPENA